MKNKLLLFKILVLCIISDVMANANTIISNQQIDPENIFPPVYKRSTSFNISLGYNRLQDQATSPLIYSGPHIGLGLGQMFRLGTNYSLNLKADVGYAFSKTDVELESTYISTDSHLLDLHFQIGLLRNINFLSNDVFRLRAGVKTDYWNSIGINTNLHNNATANDIVITGAISGQMDINISGTSRKGEPLLRKFSITSHYGILNFNNSPGYNYNIDMPLISDIQAEDIQRKWKMNGKKILTEISFETQRTGKFAGRLSYEFLGISAPGSFEPYGMTRHSLKYTIFLNKR